jgi:hypothetical protein
MAQDPRVSQQRHDEAPLDPNRGGLPAAGGLPDRHRAVASTVADQRGEYEPFLRIAAAFASSSLVYVRVKPGAVTTHVFGLPSRFVLHAQAMVVPS